MNYHLLERQGKAHFVRYENLSENNVVEIEKILRFLEAPDYGAIFTLYEDELTQKNAALLRAWNNFARGSFQRIATSTETSFLSPRLRRLRQCVNMR
jgi:hypothetical protein